MNNNNIDLSGNTFRVSANKTNTSKNSANTSKNSANPSNNVTTEIKEVGKNINENNVMNLADNIHNDNNSQMLYKDSKEFNIFKNELDSLINNNLYILKECKSNKRLLDVRYAELAKTVSYIQISVIVLSTLSGFLQSTKEFFYTPNNIVSVSGISISTYISLILSVSKYYKFDETKESIHNLREKYGNLHNKIEYRMDILGPHTNYKLWEHQDVSEKLNQWSMIKKSMDEEYIALVETKQTLTTEFESIMDSKSRNENYIKDKELVLANREKLFKSMIRHNDLEAKIKSKNISTNFDSVIQLPDDDLNNWDDPV